ncbi:response regulator transcription factor [Crateriforma spongiae]|uniref:response regulator transcription factor n=1 Tax=Crateriforma spongiae TaxID=2724528 RepID=UPI001446F454|nr:response regulator transcription factor [Crateriforma spongiae]
MFSLMIVDDHPVVCDALSLFLRQYDIDTVATCGTGKDALRHAESRTFDVALLDVRLPDMDGLLVLEKLVEAVNDLPIVMFSGHENPTYVARAAAMGAVDFLDKSASVAVVAATLVEAVQKRSGRNGSQLLRIQNLMQAPVEPEELPDGMPLTSREAQVLRHMGFGLSNREIANSLRISVETVKEHVQNVLRKLNASDRTAAAVRAVREGLV